MGDQNQQQAAEQPLFRTEALRFSSQKSLGAVTIVQPLALKTLTTLIFIIVTVAAAYLILGEYARKETVQGYLEPSSGTVAVFARSPGAIVHHVMVNEGDRVTRNDPLVTVRFPNTVAGGNSTITELIKELDLQQAQLVQQADRFPINMDNELRVLRAKVKDYERELGQQQTALNLQEERLAVADKLLGSMSKLRATGGISEAQWLQMIAERLDLRKEKAAIGQRIVQLESAKKSIAFEIQQLPATYADKRLQTQLQLSGVNQKRAEVLGRQDELILAPISGRITAVQAKVGLPAMPTKSLLSLVPDDEALEAVLLMPSSSIGFLDPGQTIRLMYDAFPYQQFGTQPAKLTSISEAPIAPSALQAPFGVAGPVYIARAAIESNNVNVLGQQRPLAPGMLLRADIILERRSLLDWLLEPLYILRGRSE